MEPYFVHLLNTDTSNNPPWRARGLTSSKVSDIVKRLKDGEVQSGRMILGYAMIFDEDCCAIKQQTYLANSAVPLDTGYKNFKLSHPQMTIREALENETIRHEIMQRRTLEMDASGEIVEELIQEQGTRRLLQKIIITCC